MHCAFPDEHNASSKYDALQAFHACHIAAVLRSQPYSNRSCTSRWLPLPGFGGGKGQLYIIQHPISTTPRRLPAGVLAGVLHAGTLPPEASRACTHSKARPSLHAAVRVLMRSALPLLRSVLAATRCSVLRDSRRSFCWGRLVQYRVLYYTYTTQYGSRVYRERRSLRQQ